ncbi:XRE family transcriptional regulator [Actinokineospora terrae]|uniref:XRE family transcriptional regulator n=1 Tax=Actinokineospora terrae TaxID=155974 RepID=UPI001FECC011|nr:XRE family transcriptional regulator [Actinokineospora terrae]
MRQLRLPQWELAERAQVSQAIIRELQYNTVERRRHGRTLEALSIALELPPGHLAGVLAGTNEDPTPNVDVGARLEAMEKRLTALTERFDRIDSALKDKWRRL